ARRARYRRGARRHRLAAEQPPNGKRVGSSAEADARPQPPPSAWRPRFPPPNEPYLRRRWDEGCHNGSRLYREVAAQGFTGSRVLVAVFVAELRRQDTVGEQVAPTAPQAPQDHLRPHGAAMLVGRRPAECSA